MTFYQALRELDHQIVGEDMCAIPTGRAYRGEQGLYADKIHILPFGEKWGGLDLSQIPERLERPNIYMGTAGLINLSHICKIKPTHAILFDVNPYQILFWNVILSAIRSNKNYAGFKHALNYSEVITRRVIDSRLSDITFSSSGSWTETLYTGDEKSLSRKTFPTSAASFAAYMDLNGFNESDYLLLREMVCHGWIGTLTLDIFDMEGWKQLSSFLRLLHQKDPATPSFIDTLYVSSVFRFAQADTDWTGRKLKEISAQSVSTVLDDKKSIVMDYRAVYSAPEFRNQMTKRDEPWQYQPATLKEFALAHGADRSVLHFA